MLSSPGRDGQRARRARRRRSRLVDGCDSTAARTSFLLEGRHLLASHGASPPIPVDGIAIRRPIPYPSKTVRMSTSAIPHLRVLRTLEADGGYPLRGSWARVRLVRPRR
jgi:hypothetical protein